ncbi:pyridoxamine 5'-phosphate oxidase family protein [Massilia sp. CCM 8734]|uniref:pyridoxamine 5'-phosphate oxidase family protein n=1 Tax=Massilia sp. CCM 8734 TaxID=2609283 RepID=UPI0027B99745|nr:pyridoxamine 5'-phosphate oxidase family protein [Massilia sp. CCM 8734]
MLTSNSEFLVLDGVATITRDKTKIKELWNFIPWFTGGEADPRITAIKITPD